MAPKPQKDPLFAAAVLKLSFQLAKTDSAPGFQAVYGGVLRDLDLTDDVVEAYLKANYDTVLKAARGKETGSPASDPAAARAKRR